MDLLVTVIGNAVADAEFRERLLKDPLTAVDNWGFRLTKGEVDMMEELLHRESVEQLRDKFEALRETLYGASCPKSPCRMSAYPPKTEQKLREDLRKRIATEAKNAA
jgi:hypothetical protein